MVGADAPPPSEAIEIVREQMRAAGLEPGALEVREIVDDDGARARGFIGSPTIRVDGRDVQEPGDEPVGLTCRVYRLRDGRISALPDRAGHRRGARGGRRERTER